MNTEATAKALSTVGDLSLLVDGRGVGLEKESLRVTPEFTVSSAPHPEPLGSALTHPHITTDYSEALLEQMCFSGERFVVFSGSKTMAAVANCGSHLKILLLTFLSSLDQSDAKTPGYGGDLGTLIRAQHGRPKHWVATALWLPIAKFRQYASKVVRNLRFLRQASAWKKRQ